METLKPGTVYIVGAGPGDPGLITERGKEYLQNADVVVYDFLAAPALLEWAPKSAEILYVGKKGGDHSKTQDQINALLVEKARQGRAVVRLKGGDPFIFGRGGEEAEVLVDAGVPFVIVPGVTSAIAAPAYAGIPLTHRKHTSTVAFVTGHEEPGKEESAIDWRALATGMGTLVFLMGMKNLEGISQKLKENGRPPQTPAAVVQWGTTPAQKTVTGTLADIAAKAQEAGVGHPAVLVVGEVAALRDRLSWFETLPLFGKRIVVTRSRSQASVLVKKLTALGAECIEAPTIELTGPADPKPLEKAVTRIGKYNWVVFTSVNGVQHFFERLLAHGKDARALAKARVGAIGPATAQSLKDYGVLADLVPKTYQAESVIEAFMDWDMDGKKVLLPRAKGARPILPDQLRAMGALVDEVEAYATLPPPETHIKLLERLSQGTVDCVTFTSSSTVANFAALFPEGGLAPALKNVAVACIGPITAQTALDLGLTVHVQAEEFTIDGLCRAVVRHFNK